MTNAPTQHPTYASPIERRLARSLINNLIRRGLIVTVWEGEDYAIRNSRSASAILAAMSSTDMDYVSATNAEQDLAVSFMLVYGNDEDLIADTSTGPLAEEIFKQVTGI